MPHEEKCRSCGASILWVQSASTGKMMPIDAQSVLGGNVALDSEGAAVVGKAGADLPGLRYVSHFATCPNAKKWRKP